MPMSGVSGAVSGMSGAVRMSWKYGDVSSVYYLGNEELYVLLWAEADTGSMCAGGGFPLLTVGTQSAERRPRVDSG